MALNTKFNAKNGISVGVPSISIIDNVGNAIFPTVSARQYLGLQPSLSGLAALVGGNSLGSALTIGTNDNYDLNLETAGSSRFTVTSAGDVGIGSTTPVTKLTVVGGVSATGGFFGPGITVSSFPTAGLLLTYGGSSAGASYIDFFTSGSHGGQAAARLRSSNISGGAGFLLSRSGFFGWNEQSYAGQEDAGTGIMRDSFGVIAQRNGTSPQELRIYKSYTDASNYERFIINTNVGTTSATQIGLSAAGTGQNRNLEIVTGGSTRMVITSAGNVGIGTSTPTERLNVVGNVRAEGNLSVYNLNTAITLDRLTVDGSQGRLFTVTDALTGSLLSVNDISGLPILEVFDDDRVIMGEYASNALAVVGRNVGVGTATPNQKLTVTGNISSTNVIYASGGNSNLWNSAYTSVNTISGNNTSTFTTVNANSANWSSVYSTTNTNSANWSSAYTTTNTNSANWSSAYTTVNANSANYILDGGNTKGANLLVGTNDNFNLNLETAGTTKMTVTSAGNVGIGTTTPGYKLDVNGTSRLGGNVIVDGDSLTMASTGWVQTWGLSYGGATTHRLSTNYDLELIGGVSTRSVTIKNGATETARFTDGRVGIGTITPTARLDIADTTLAGSGSLAGSILNLAQTWNTTGAPTAIKLNVTNTGSGAASNLLDLQVDTSSKFKVGKGATGSANMSLGSSGGDCTFSTSGNLLTVGLGSHDVQLCGSLQVMRSNLQAATFFLGHNDTSTSLAPALLKDGNYILAQRNGINPQIFRVYNTYSSSTNFERAILGWDSNIFYIGTEKGSAGGAATPIQFYTNGVPRMVISSGGLVTVRDEVGTQQQVINNYACLNNAYGASTSAGSTPWLLDAATNNILHNYSTRLTVTNSGTAAASGVFTQTIEWPLSELTDVNGMVYAEGTAIIRCYYLQNAQSVRIRIWNNSSSTWSSYVTAVDVSRDSQWGVWRASFGGNYLTKLEWETTSPPGNSTNVMSVEYYPTRSNSGIRYPHMFAAQGASKLLIGGGKSTHAAIVGSGNTLKIRNGNDSADGSITAAAATFSTTLSVAGISTFSTIRTSIVDLIRSDANLMPGALAVDSTGGQFVSLGNCGNSNGTNIYGNSTQGVGIYVGSTVDLLKPTVLGRQNGTTSTTDLSIYNTANSQTKVGIRLGNSSTAASSNIAINFVDYTNADYGQIRGVYNGAVQTGQIAFLTANGGALAETLRITNTGNVGIGTVTPNEKLTVVGAISSTNVIYASGGNSNLWNSAYTSVNTNSANGATTYTTVNTNSANWSSVYSTTNANSANWSSSYATATAVSAIGASTYSTVNSNSANWSSVYTLTNANSANWSSVYTTTNINSAGWASAYTTTNSNSANWSSVYTTTNANSANWNSTYTTVNTNSANYILAGGNSKGANLLIGTNDNFALNFETNGTTKMSITNAGNVGIGVASPSSKLHIVGGDTQDGFTAATVALGYSTTGAYPHFIHTRHNAGTSVNNAIDLYTSNGTEAGVYPTHAVHGLTIINGSVGVSTTAPNEKLTVAGNISSSNIVYALGGNSSLWNSAYTSVNTISANGATTFTTVNTNSSNWSNAYTTTNTNSASWSNVYSTTNANSANWSSVYTITNTNSASWSSVYSSYNAASATILKGTISSTGQGNITIPRVGGGNESVTISELGTSGNPTFNNLTVSGNLSVVGDFTYLNTGVSVTSALSVVNTGTGPALLVRQSGTTPIAHFIDADGTGDIVFANNGFVGIGTTSPTNLLHLNSVAGNGVAQLLVQNDTDTAVPIVQFLRRRASGAAVLSNDSLGRISALGSKSSTVNLGAGYIEFQANGSPAGFNNVLPSKINFVTFVNDAYATYTNSLVNGAFVAGGTTGQFIFNKNDNIGGDYAPDTGISRLSAGVIGIGNATAGTSGGTLIAGSIGIDTTNFTDAFLSAPGSLFANGNIKFGGTLRSSSSSLTFRPTYDNTALLFAASTHSLLMTSGGAGTPIIFGATDATDPLALYSGGGEKIRVTTAGNVGIGTAVPNEKLTVAGNISSTNVVYALGGNSNLWNSAYTSVNTNSANGASVFTTVNANSANWSSIYTTTNTNSAKWDSTYTTVNTNSANYILDGGNTKGANLLVGTNDNFNLNLETAGTTKMTVTSAGDVGIGTTSTQTRLDVNGDTRAGGFLYIDRTSGNLTSYFQLKARGAAEVSNYGNPVGNGAAEFGAVGTSGLIVGTQNATPLVLGTTNAERVRITAAGNVGIGATGPNAKLEVVESTSNIASVILRATTAASPRVEFIDGAGTPNKWSVGAGAGTTSDGKFFIYDARQNAHRLNIDASGNVGIGTIAPSTLLHIQKDQNSDTELRVQNSSNLSSATATINLVGSQGSTLVLQANPTTVAAPDATRALIRAPVNVFGISLKAESTAGTLQFYTGGAAAANERLRITNGGNVGIGTTTPGYLLDLNGNGRVTDTLYFGTSSITSMKMVGDNLTINSYAGNPVKIDALQVTTFAFGVTFQYGDLTLNKAAGTDTYIRSTNQDLRLQSGSTYNLLLNPTAGNVGIGTITPNEKLTVTGNISSSNVVYASGGNSNLWNSAYTSVNTISANGATTYTTVNTNSAAWSSVYSTTNANSANWSSVYTLTNSNSANWSSVYTTTNTNSANWSSVYSTTNANSANWSSVYTTTNANSSSWASVYTTTNANSSSWASVYTTTNTNSAAWSSVYTTTNTNSANWNSSYTLVNSNNANWTSVYTTTNANSANWSSVYTTTNTNSANWSSAYTSVNAISGNGASTYSTVNANSANWSSVYTTTNTNSSSWASVYTNTNTNSGGWSSVYTTTNTNSANWTSAYTLVNANNVNWTSVYTTTNANSANWSSVYTTTNTNSANWTSAYTTVNTSSPSWNSVYSTTNANSALWNSDFTTVNTNSARWSSVYTTVNTNSASYIVNGGNTLGGTITIGTNDANNFNLETGGTARISMLAAGQVGIGTTTPDADLVVYKNVVGAPTTLKIRTATGTASRLDFYRTDNYVATRFDVLSTNEFQFYNNNDVATPKYIINGTNGNFGIGTASTVHKVTIGGSLSASGTLYSECASFGDATANVFLERDAANALGIRNSTAAQTLNVYGTYTSGTSFERLTLSASSLGGVIGHYAGGGGGTARDLLFQTSNATRMTIAAGGSVNVAGHFSAATKSFLIDHPTQEGKKLQYGVVESNQHSVLVRGKTSESIIELPEEWSGLVHEDSVTVQLTPIGSYQQLYVVSQDNQRVVVGGSTGKYNYTIYGERKDVDKLQTVV
jgi:hypothetical protein